jgi:hypothetical protein
MKKPDRWERTLAKGFPRAEVRPQDLILTTDALKLLRQEHAWVRRMVQKTRDFMHEHEFSTTGLDDVLDQLKERAK